MKLLAVLRRQVGLLAVVRMWAGLRVVPWGWLGVLAVFPGPAESLAIVSGWAGSPTVYPGQAGPRSVLYIWVGPLTEDPGQTDMLTVFPGARGSVDLASQVGGATAWPLYLVKVTAGCVGPIPSLLQLPLCGLGLSVVPVLSKIEMGFQGRAQKCWGGSMSSSGPLFSTRGIWGPGDHPWCGTVVAWGRAEMVKENLAPLCF